ncbi:FMN-binding negative transcriptional regulator [Pseudoalteromonas sp. JBTF-M23]|uniref:FMN-binding negative transcriptional regulator n=1 Tax=Pseudoalteromonas caenipelagi TaxID=2726988 RepID=A0A849VAD0_9GAMM|nr:FMN-binding negative transcriptional regulator [Pseudoalteromonas caenipelagi]NOU49885.1 FMN-binding negative transcriptional regulator [Pseudoalteromonas caenipelagi]
MTYPPAYFQDDSQASILALVQQAPMATILFATNDDELNNAIYAPLVFDESQQVFIGHVAANNPLAQHQSVKVKILFHGPNGYLSPNHSDELVVPTWLYANAQLTGELTLVRDHKRKLSMMNFITEHFEQPFANPWPVSALDDEKRDAMFKHIEFFTVSIHCWRGHFKLSQNKPLRVREQIKQSLSEQGSTTLAQQI